METLIMVSTSDFFTRYLDYVDLDNNESPALYHRWVCASIIGAMLGRQVHLRFGHGRIYPNQYMMLMGHPSSKKGTAMRVGYKLLEKTGYSRFAADKNSKEQFLKGMKSFDGDSLESMLELEALVLDSPSESYVFAEEFVDFIGQGDTGFMMLFTKLWDNHDVYKHPKITGKDVVVNKPTVNILGASTATTFAIAVPPEAAGSGFLSRVIFIYADPTGKRIPFPSARNSQLGDALIRDLKAMRKITGEIKWSPEAYKITGEIYLNMVPVPDERFVYYMERRQQHHIKLSMILAIAEGRTIIELGDVIKANTLLITTEARMPKALGEFGASKYAAATNMVMTFLESKFAPQSISDIWKHVGRDVGKQTELAEILNNLRTAEKIQVVVVKGKAGYLPLHKPVIGWKEIYYDKSWLTENERNF